MGSVKDNLVRVLHRLHLGYNGSTTLDLITHISVTYAVIKNGECLANDKWFREA